MSSSGQALWVPPPITDRPVTVAIIGAGRRSELYGEYALQHPQRMQVTAVADPDPARRNAIAQTHRIAPERCFDSYEQLFNRPRIADAIINGTLDHLHYPSAMGLLKVGYHMLLEKPIAHNEAHVREMIAAAQEHRAVVMVCHVLRYASFYERIKQLLADRVIGDIVSMHTAENVAYGQMALGFVRGRWNNTEKANPILLAKCCHDIDLITWLVADAQPKRLSSFGSLKQFRPANAPPGSTARCMDGCKVESTCVYSAPRAYVFEGSGPPEVWAGLPARSAASREEKLRSLASDNPYGRCVWRCDNDVVDHQTVMIEFDNGVTVTHDLFCATSEPSRTIHILGSAGEIEGELRSSRLVVRRHKLDAPEGYTQDTFDTGDYARGHGGGDAGLIADFISVLRGESKDGGRTRIEHSLNGHLICFAADQAMRERRVVEM